MKTQYFLAAMSSLVLVHPLGAQNFVDILPGTNNVPINSVNYVVDGIDVSQTSEASGVAVNRDGSVYLKSVVVNDGGVTKTLDSFNSLGATVTNLNLTSQAGGVGVFDNGTVTTTSDISAYATSLAGVTQDTDLLNYAFYDGVSNLPGSSTADFDLHFAKGFEANDFVLVSERYGNTFFTIVPLDANGDVIAGANTLRFGGPATKGAYQAYDWNSGYAAESYQASQAFGFSVASIGKFFEGSAAAEQAVYGFRIDNNGEADVKFFGLSDNSFVDNPNNPTVPEPSVAIISMIGMTLLLRRRR
ncbi:hypothetical protein ACFSSA_10715 [Luteolibacter algae]|uniref:PEP-CTERM sorting domain-containing protein n=1 Tax=Luteolibacter algae TaxID=454151 RepID=A0ABW5DBY0_9BACT